MRISRVQIECLNRGLEACIITSLSVPGHTLLCPVSCYCLVNTVTGCCAVRVDVVVVMVYWNEACLSKSQVHVLCYALRKVVSMSDCRHYVETEVCLCVAKSVFGLRYAHSLLLHKSVREVPCNRAHRGNLRPYVISALPAPFFYPILQSHSYPVGCRYSLVSGCCRETHVCCQCVRAYLESLPIPCVQSYHSLFRHSITRVTWGFRDSLFSGCCR
jgi:hypothetical protein